MERDAYGSKKWTFRISNLTKKRFSIPFKKQNLLVNCTLQEEIQKKWYYNKKNTKTTTYKSKVACFKCTSSIWNSKYYSSFRGNKVYSFR